MEASSSASPSGSHSAAADWAKSLKSVALQVRQMGVGCSRIYYDRETRELALFKATTPSAANRYEELSLERLKSRTITILSSTNDLEVKYRAVKALLKLMSAKPMDASTLQELTQVSLHAMQGLSPGKAQTIRLLLESAKRSTPSEQGGTGVHFLEVEPPPTEDPHVKIPYGIYKFVPNPRQVLFANLVLKSLGFIVPKTKMILRDSPEGRRAIELFTTSCRDRTIPQKGQILVMDLMNAQPFNRMAKE